MQSSNKTGDTMKKLSLAAASLLASAAFSTAAFAADPVTVIPAVTPVATPVVVEPDFAWDRFYVGAFGGWWDCCGARVGINAGRNFVIGDSFVVGIDLSVAAYEFSDLGWEGYALARAGFLLGDKALVYGALGVGTDIPGTPVMAAAIGAEIAFGHNLAFRTEALVYDVLNDRDLAISAGLTWYFGR